MRHRRFNCALHRSSILYSPLCNSPPMACSYSRRAWMDTFTSGKRKNSAFSPRFCALLVANGSSSRRTVYTTLPLRALLSLFGTWTAVAYRRRTSPACACLDCSQYLLLESVRNQIVR